MKNLKQFLLTAAILPLFWACSGEGVSLDPSVQQAMVDSIVNTQRTALTESMTKACETQYAAKVTAKVDSLMKLTTK